MATKRSKRIDPNEAFAAIVGNAEPEMPQPAAVPAANTRPPAAESAVQKAIAEEPDRIPANIQPAKSVDDGEGCTVSSNEAIGALGADVINNSPASVPVMASRPAASASARQEVLQSQPPLPNEQNAIAQEAAAISAQEEPARLVQKGYYITEEQHKRLGIFSVMQGTDRSAIVRKALDMYFEANRELL